MIDKNAAGSTGTKIIISVRLCILKARNLFHLLHILLNGVEYSSAPMVYFLRVFYSGYTYECVSKSFRTGCVERELQMVQISATRYSCIAILRVSLMSFAAITLCLSSQRGFLLLLPLFLFILLSTQSGNFWIHPRIS
jgi:hypothetical protein